MKAFSSLLCRFGQHRPQSGARWNQGYGFTTCERCGCDLVRSMIDGWRVPLGYRVVWRPPEPPPASVIEQHPPVEPSLSPRSDLASAAAEVPTPKPSPPRSFIPEASSRRHMTNRSLTAGKLPRSESPRSPFDFSDFDRDDDDRVHAPVLRTSTVVSAADMLRDIPATRRS